MWTKYLDKSTSVFFVLRTYAAPTDPEKLELEPSTWPVIL